MCETILPLDHLRAGPVLDKDLYNFLHDTRTHYGDGTMPFDELCIRAHVYR